MPYDYLRLLATTPFSTPQKLREYCEQHKMKKDTEWEITSTGQKGKGPVCNYKGLAKKEEESEEKKEESSTAETSSSSVFHGVPQRHVAAAAAALDDLFSSEEFEKDFDAFYDITTAGRKKAKESHSSLSYAYIYLGQKTNLTNKIHSRILEAFGVSKDGYEDRVYYFGGADHESNSSSRMNLGRIAMRVYGDPKDSYLNKQYGEPSEKDLREFAAGAVSAQIRLILNGLVNKDLTVDLNRTVSSTQWSDSSRKYNGGNFESASLKKLTWYPYRLRLRVPLGRVCNTWVNNHELYKHDEELEVTVSTKGIEDSCVIGDAMSEIQFPTLSKDKILKNLFAYLSKLKSGELPLSLPGNGGNSQGGKPPADSESSSDVDGKSAPHPGKSDSPKDNPAAHWESADCTQAHPHDKLWGEHYYQPSFKPEEFGHPCGLKLDGEYKDSYFALNKATVVDKFGKEKKILLGGTLTAQDAYNKKLVSDIYDELCDGPKANMEVLRLPAEGGGELCKTAVDAVDTYGEADDVGFYTNLNVCRGLDLLFGTKSDFFHGVKNAKGEVVPSHLALNHVLGDFDYAEPFEISIDEKANEHKKSFLWKPVPVSDITGKPHVSASTLQVPVYNAACVWKAAYALQHSQKAKELFAKLTKPEKAAVCNKIRIATAFIMSKYNSSNFPSPEKFYDSMVWKKYLKPVEALDDLA